MNAATPANLVKDPIKEAEAEIMSIEGMSLIQK
jgi:hypothetical protein